MAVASQDGKLQEVIYNAGAVVEEQRSGVPSVIGYIVYFLICLHFLL